MRTLLLSAVFFAATATAASAQSAKTVPAGTSPNPDAPVNISEPGLRPAQPATYSATSLPDAQKGQFYVKDDKPATSDGRIIEPLSPEALKALEMFKAKQAAGSNIPAAATKPAPKTAPSNNNNKK